MSYEGHGHQIPLALSWPCHTKCWQDAETTSPGKAACWNKKPGHLLGTKDTPVSLRLQPQTSPYVAKPQDYSFYGMKPTLTKVCCVTIQSSAECWAQQLHPWSAAVLQPYHGPKQSWEMVELNISALKDSIGRAKASQPPHHTHKMHGWRLDAPQKRWKALGEPLDKHCALQLGDSLQNTGTAFWNFQTLTQSFKI